MPFGIPSIPGIGDISGSGFTGGAATSGDVGPATVGFGPVSVGGLFGSPASSSANNFLVPALVAGVAILAFMFFKR